MSDHGLVFDLGKQGISKPCESRVAADCEGRFLSVDGNTHSCIKCHIVEQRMRKAGEAPEGEGLTPDDHPETGYADILTDEEKEWFGLATRWV